MRQDQGNYVAAWKAENACILKNYDETKRNAEIK